MGAGALLLAPAAGLFADAVLHAFLARAARGLGPIRVQFLSFAAGGLLTAGLLLAMLGGLPLGPADRAGYLVLHLLVYACFGFCFFNVISANVSSLRVRIVREMLARHPQPMPAEALAARYSAREMLRARLERLRSGGQVELVDGRYHLRKHGISLIGAVFAGVRRLLTKV